MALIGVVRPALVWAAVCATALPSTAAQDAGHPRHGGGGKTLGASAVFDAQGTLWAVQADGAHVVLRRSIDRGSTWSGPVNVNEVPEPIAAEGESRPKVAVGAGGEIYVSWTRPLAKPYTGEIRFARSTDAGLRFAPPITVHTDRREITHRFDSLAVGTEGRVFLAWIDKRDQEDARAEGLGYAGAALYLAISDDRGAHFRGDYKIADHSCECCRIALLPQADGGVLAFWRHVFEGGIRDHALARVDADGATVSMRRATFDDWRIDACPHHGPSLAQTADGALHAVWFTQGPGREGVHYGQLREGGIHRQRRVGGEGAAHADIAAHGAQLAIVWTEYDGRAGRLLAMRSTDDGATWRESVIASTADRYDQPKLLRHGERFYVLWNRGDAPLQVAPVP